MSYPSRTRGPTYPLRGFLSPQLHLPHHPPPTPFFFCSCNPDARAWWTSVPLGGAGSPQAPLIDGVLADGAGYSVAGANCFHATNARINPDRCNELIACKVGFQRAVACHPYAAATF